MGLDMYLRAKKYVSAWEHCPAKEKAQFNQLLNAVGLTNNDIDASSPGIYISVTAAYWRKANAIHGWFVRECQDGSDQCQTSHVGRAQLEELVALCKQVLKERGKATELLPPTPGFFFGGTDLDEGYFEDIEQTITQLERVLGNKKLKEFDFEYHASW